MKGLRYTVAALLAALAVPVSVVAWRWPLEAGSVLFAPALFGVAGALVSGAVALAAPRRARQRPPRPAGLNAPLLALCGVLAVIVGANQLVRWVASWV